MKPHHIAWLEAHQHRSAEWLASALRDGFDVHHVDGNHANNDPDNLVLIEHTDHMRAHGMCGVLGRLTARSAEFKRASPRVTRKAKARAIATYEATKQALAAEARGASER